MIFLNMFIAVVVDSYLGEQEKYSMPVLDSDVERFIEVWGNYDPKASGYIPIEALD
jgi:hypothetical protein